jgi:glucose-6-phosphate 1-dehydrogenase
MSSPAQIVIYGASGDLARRKLMPALVRLAAEGQEFSVVGVSRTRMSHDAFRDALREALEPELREPFDALAPRIFYHAGDADDAGMVASLSRTLDGLPGAARTGRLFYLSLRPALFAAAVARLAEAGMLTTREGEETAWRRVVVEKPFGHDLASARALNEDLHASLLEEQIYRIDHYLGKETVQNLLGFRFHNAIFEPLWSRHHVALVQITVAEEGGVEPERVGYYEGTGALRDVVQNHVLQILGLAAMEPPASLEPDAVRDQKVALLRGLHHPPAPPQGVRSVRARYGPGEVGGEPVPGYAELEGVPADSTTETWVALRAEVATWRWSGVPFLLRHGKRMPKRFTEVQVQFRRPPLQLFQRPEGVDDDELARRLRDDSLCRVRPNVLTLCIQPHEGIRLSFGVKEPGTSMRMAPAHLAFDYREHFQRAPAAAYQRLLLDVLRGDPTLFLRADEIEAAWRYADEVRRSWQGPEAPPLLEYPAGSWGPPQAERLLEGCEGDFSRG